MSATLPLVHVVDDDPAVRTALGRLLRANRYRMIASASGAEFLARPPDACGACVLLDLAMPGVGGLAVQRRMSETGDERPVIFLTGEGDIPSGVNAMKAGAVDFLTKPVDGEVLFAAIDEAIRRNETNRIQRKTQAATAERIAGLTAREHEVLRLVVAGLPNKRIAQELGIAEKTVKIHRGRVMEKTQVDSLADLVRLTATLGMAPPSLSGETAASE